MYMWLVKMGEVTDSVDDLLEVMDKRKFQHINGPNPFRGVWEQHGIQYQAHGIKTNKHGEVWLSLQIMKPTKNT